jgi:hypothetical protein
MYCPVQNNIPRPGTNEELFVFYIGTFSCAASTYVYDIMVFFLSRFVRRKNATSNTGAAPHANGSVTTNAFENGDMTSPELSMVLEKAIVLLNGNEFSALRRILAEYEATEINVDTFAESLLQLITDQEKVRNMLQDEDVHGYFRGFSGSGGGRSLCASDVGTTPDCIATNCDVIEPAKKRSCIGLLGN